MDFNSFFYDFITIRKDDPSKNVQMRLYTLTKHQLFVFFGLFSLALAVSIIIGLSGPAIVCTVPFQLGNLSDHLRGNDLGPFSLRFPPLSELNQQFWLAIQFESFPSLRTAKSVTDRITVDVSLIGYRSLSPTEPSSLAQRSITESLLETTPNDTAPGETVAAAGSPAVGPLPSEAFNSVFSRRITCYQQVCESPIVLLHATHISSHFYRLNVTFSNATSSAVFRWLAGQVAERSHSTDDAGVVFQLSYYNSAFTRLEVWARFGYLMMVFVATILFANSLRKYPLRIWSLEQKFLVILLPLLVLYDNPAFALTFLLRSAWPRLIDTICQANFLAVLLYFWLCFYHGIRQRSRSCLRFYLPKVLIVGTLWTLSMLMGIWSLVRSANDYGYVNRTDDVTSGLWLRVVLFTFVTIYVLYLLFLVVRAFTELRNVPLADIRLKLSTVFLLLVVCTSLAVFILRFAQSPTRDDADSGLGSALLHADTVALHRYFRQHSAALRWTHQGSSLEFMVLLALINLHLIAMAFVYSPSKSSLQDSTLTERSTISIAPDSDDEFNKYSSSDDEHVLLSAEPPSHQTSSNLRSRPLSGRPDKSSPTATPVTVVSGGPSTSSMKQARPDKTKTKTVRFATDTFSRPSVAYQKLPDADGLFDSSDDDQSL